MSTSLALRSVPSHVASRYVDEGWWSDETLPEFLTTALTDSRQRFQVWSDERPEQTTTGEVFERALRFAGALETRGVAPGDVVAFQLPNWTEAAIAFWGATCAGATVVPIVHTYAARELRIILEQCRPRVFVVADQFGRRDLYAAALEAQARELVESLIVVGRPRSDATAFEAFTRHEPLRHLPSLDANDPAVIAYTSGTGKRPKGVVHTHRTLLAEIRQLEDLPQPDHRPVLVGSPVGHVAGMTAAFGDAVARGKPIHMVDRWEPEAVLDILRD